MSHEKKVTDAINAVEDRMRGTKLSLDHYKIELVIISNQKTMQHTRIMIGECIID